MPITHLPRALPRLVDGVVSRAELWSAGVNPDLGDRLVRERPWLRLAPSTYLAGTVHRPTPSSYGRRCCTRAGTTYTHAVRAVVDTARRTTDLQTARALVLGATCQGHCTPVALAEEVEAGHSRGSGLCAGPSTTRSREPGRRRRPRRATTSRVLVREARLPPFLLNPVLTADGVQVGSPDGYLVGTGVGWQVGSVRHHGQQDDLDRTLAVHDAYAAHGITVLHVTPRRLRQLRHHWPELLVAAVAAHRGRRPRPR